MPMVNVSKLEGAALDWAVAKCEGVENNNSSFTKGRGFCIRGGDVYAPSRDWSVAGPIIERERIDIHYVGPKWAAACCLNSLEEPDDWSGKTPLIAAMRCYVASKMGDSVEIPEELL